MNKPTSISQRILQAHCQSRTSQRFNQSFVKELANTTHNLLTDRTKDVSKEAIVAEYLTGTITYRALEAKYGVPSRSICDWVMEYQGRKPSWKEKKRRKLEIEGKTPEPELPKDVKLLQDALRRSQLKSELLEEMLKLSEEYTGVDLRKKFGAKR